MSIRSGVTGSQPAKTVSRHGPDRNRLWPFTVPGGKHVGRVHGGASQAPSNGGLTRYSVERTTGFEPATLTLATLWLTEALHSRPPRWHSETRSCSRCRGTISGTKL